MSRSSRRMGRDGLLYNKGKQWGEEARLNMRIDGGIRHVLSVSLAALFARTLCAAPPGDWRKGLPEPVLEKHPEWVDLYYDVWRIADRQMSEYGGQHLFDTAFTKGRIWMWDTVWISHFGVYVQDAHPDIVNPMHGIDLFYAAQRPDGCIPHVWDATGNHNWQIHNPIFSLGELNYYRHVGDKDRLERVLPILDRFFVYLKKTYGRPDGLYRSFDWSNGMDNRPNPGVSIDSTCEQAMVALQLKDIAAIVGDAERAARFEAEHRELKQRINERMWIEEDGFYTDCTRSGEPTNVWSVASYWSLLSGVATPERAARMRGHLRDASNFKTPVMVPTLGRKSPFYDGTGGDYWRGSMWIPTSTMVIMGLAKYGYIEDARDIARNGLDGVFQAWKRRGTLFENYDQERVGFPGEKSKADFVGWSGIQPIATLIETLIGIRLDAPGNRIRWTLRMTGKHGVRNLKWGAGYSRRVDLVADARSAPEDAVTIRVKTEAPFVLEVDTGFANKSFTIREAGPAVLHVPRPAR